jgi:DNA-binding NtrC family response regulator
MVASSRRLQEVIKTATHIASGPAKVLLTGESGVGKDLLARHIHANSPRSGNAYVALNCAAVTETLLESELFGHVKGSFTGAWRTKPGLLQQAHGGTLFLDEVGEMSLRMQAVLLRFLETGEVQAVGGDHEDGRVDVRVIAATNRNLQELVARGEFREDLLHRLRVVHLHIPPLRERREDIPPLLEHALDRLPHRKCFTKEAHTRLCAYRWPGNIRELLNVVERSFWMSREPQIDLESLPAEVRTSDVVLVGTRDRRRSTADRLYEALTSGAISFWDDVHRMFLERDLTRGDIQGLVRRGLEETHGNYRALLTLFQIPPTDYKRLLNFLASHGCQVDVRPFRLGVPLRKIAPDPVAILLGNSEIKELSA